MGTRTPVGRLLVERGAARLADVEAAVAAARQSDGRLCSKLLEMGACDEGSLAQALAERQGLPGVDLSRSVLDLAALDLVPQAVAESDLILPLSLEGDRLHLAVDSPQTAERVVSEVRFVTGRETSLYVAVLHALRGALAAAYGARAQGQAVWRGAAAPRDAAPALVVHAPPPLPALDPGLPELTKDDLLIVEDAPEEVVCAVKVVAGPRRVLVVDDEAAVLLLVQRALEHGGYAVLTAADGEDGLQKARTLQPDLVLLDAMLPKLHGFEVARRLRSDPATRRLPVVIMSAVYRGWRFAEDAHRSLGVQDYVEKPFRLDDLLRRVDAVMGARPPAPSSAAQVVQRGRRALAEGRLAEAVAGFEEAVRVDSFSAEAHLGLGEALRLQGEIFLAMTALERSLELRPSFSAMRTLAALYLEKGFQAKAAEVLERAVHAAPDAATREALRRELLPLLG